MSVARRVAAAASVLVLASCASGDPAESRSEQTLGASPSGPATESPSEAAATPVSTTPTSTTRPTPLRPGERRVTLAMPEAYTPAAPHDVGTDDYRCFILDPKLKRDAFLTGTGVLPGNPDVVHHVILFRVPPTQLVAAQALDDAEPGQGWTCFGNTGFGEGPQLDDAPWLAAWAPGATESVVSTGFGTRLEKGTKIVMQVHYNLLAGAAPDISATQLRLAPGTSGLTELHTMLLPAPVELPCRPGHTGSPLCERGAAVADVVSRFGTAAGSTADLLHLLCGGEPEPGPVQSCVRVLDRPTTIRGVAGHMHLLGRSIRVEVKQGNGPARTVLDIPLWDFDDQGARQIAPVHLDPFDTVTVTCRHVQWLRDRLPAFEGEPDRYVVWGEGTTDEMCLGILTVTTP